jgi:lipopolysaccharide export LptBFGC system permease protein LptF
MAFRDGDGIMNKGLRAALFVTRFLQWASAVIVMSIASYFIARYPRNEHIIYEEVIVRH